MRIAHQHLGVFVRCNGCSFVRPDFKGWRGDRTYILRAYISTLGVNQKRSGRTRSQLSQRAGSGVEVVFAPDPAVIATNESELDCHLPCRDRFPPFSTRFSGNTFLIFCCTSFVTPRKTRLFEKILWETAPDKLFAETIIRNCETKEGKTVPFTFVMAPLRKTTRHLLSTPPLSLRRVPKYRSRRPVAVF